MGIPEKIKAIEEEIHKTQINKATEFHIGLLKAKIAKLKRELEENTHGKTVAKGGGSVGYDIRKSGDATVSLIGFPSVGKSTLLNSLTNAKSKTGSYQFTTLTAVPGMMEHRGAKIQILDLPGIIKGASTGKGMGKRVLSVARNSDLVLIVLDVFQPQHLSILIEELSNIGVKINSRPPNVLVNKSSTGGLSVNIQVQTNVTEKLVREIFRVYGIHNGSVTIREPNLSTEELIDVVNENRVYIPCVVVLNKIDLVNKEFLESVSRTIGIEFVSVSANSNMYIEKLKDVIYKKLDFVSIYLKPKGGETDFKEPLIMMRGCTVKDVCNKLHRNLVKDFKFANVWGTSVKFPGQKTGLDHVLHDKDILTITKKIS